MLSLIYFVPINLALGAQLPLTPVIIVAQVKKVGHHRKNGESSMRPSIYKARHGQPDGLVI